MSNKTPTRETKAKRQTKIECDHKAVMQALWNYHHALDTRQHGGRAADIFVSEVENVLGKPWIRNATLDNK